MKLVTKILSSDLGKIFSGNLVVQITTVLQAVIVSRILGPEGKGEFIEIILWPTIISGFSILGLYTGIAKLCARDCIFNHWNFAKTTLKATLIVGIIGTLVSCIISPLLIEWDNKKLYSIIIVFSSFVLINNVARGFNAIDHGRKDFVRYSITRSILNPIFFCFLLVLYLFRKLTIESVVYSLLAANLIVCLVRVFLTCYSQRKKEKAYPVKKLFKYSLKFSVSDLSEPIYAYFDKAVVALVLVSYDLGIYTTAFSAASLVNILSNVYGTKIFSDIASGSTPNNINVMLRHNLILMGIASILLAIVLPILIPIIFGEDFTPAILPAIFLIFTCIVQGQSFIIERGILALGFPFAGAKAKALTMILLAIIAMSCKLAGAINVNIMIFIITFCQIWYFGYMLLQFKQLCNVKIDILPRKSDFRYLIERIIK